MPEFSMTTNAGVVISMTNTAGQQPATRHAMETCQRPAVASWQMTLCIQTYVSMNPIVSPLGWKVVVVVGPMLLKLHTLWSSHSLLRVAPVMMHLWWCTCDHALVMMHLTRNWVISSRCCKRWTAFYLMWMENEYQLLANMLRVISCNAPVG